MKKARNTILWLALAAAVGLGILWEAFPLPDATDRLDSIPTNGVGFSGVELPITDIEREVFVDVHLVKRYYQVGEQAFLLTVLDGTHNRNAVHDPSYCFQGSGWSTTSSRKIAVDSGYAEIITLEKEGAQREVVLWFSNGRDRYASIGRYWAEATLRRLTLGYSGSEPVRVIIQPAEENTLDWEGLFIDFSILWEI